MLDNKFKMYYVPICESIKILFKNDHFVQQYFSKKVQSNNFSDICHGNYYKKSIFFSKNTDALQILLYQDAFEVCNPLGAFKSKHKIIGIYYTICNIPPWQRSKVEQIQLVALIYESCIKRFGFERVLNVIIDDLKKIETEGLNIEIKDNVINLKGTLIAVAGDNLGSHQIGRFNEYFKLTGYFCRYCYTNNIKSQNDISKIFELRNKNLHSFDVNMTLTCNDNFKGVKFNSVLNTLNYYHVCEPGLPPCLAHDLF